MVMPPHTRRQREMRSRRTVRSDHRAIGRAAVAYTSAKDRPVNRPIVVSVAWRSRLIGSSRMVISCRSIRLSDATTHSFNNTHSLLTGGHGVADTVVDIDCIPVLRMSAAARADAR